MLTGDNITVKAVHGISASDMQRIRDFLQGAVYCWCKIVRENGSLQEILSEVIISIGNIIHLVYCISVTLKMGKPKNTLLNKQPKMLGAY